MQLVATSDTDCYFWPPPLFRDTLFHCCLSHLWDLFSLSQLLNLLMFIQIFTHVKFAENKRSWPWEDVSFFCWVVDLRYGAIFVNTGRGIL
jgi:hypothetical protein